MKESNIIALVMLTKRPTLKSLKTEFLSKLEEIKNVLLGDRCLQAIKENTELLNPALNYVENWITDNLNGNFEGLKVILEQIVPEAKLIRRDVIQLTLSTGEYLFTPVSILQTIKMVGREYPLHTFEGDKQVNFRLPKLNNYDNYSCYCETPEDHKAELEKAEYNHLEALREVELITNLFNESQINGATEYDKTRLAVALKGAKERVLIFKNQLEGAREQYEGAKQDYISTQIEKLIANELGADHCKEVEKLVAEKSKAFDKVKYIHKSTRYQTKQEKANLEVYREIKEGIDEKLSSLNELKENIENKYNTIENRQKFANDFIPFNFL